MKAPRKGYRGNDYSRITSPRPRLRVPAFHRIQRFCSLKSNPLGSQPTTEGERVPHNVDSGHPRLPILGNLEAYGVNAHRRERLWDSEIRRLLQLNSSAEECLQPNIETNNPFFETGIEPKAFEDLEVLAGEARHALFACIVDDEVEAKPFSGATFPFVRDYYDALRRFNDRDIGPHVPGREPQTYYVEPVDEEDARKTRLTRTSRYDVSDKPVVNSTFHYIVDQITATVAQIAIRVSESEYWLVVVLACLAQLATKMKIIHSNFAKFISVSFQEARQWHHEFKLGRDSLLEQPNLSDDSPIIERHIREHMTVSSWLARCIITVLENLGDQKPWWKEGNYIDSCALIYDTGLKPTRTILYQNNHGRISGTSDKIAMSFSSVALETVWRLSDMVTPRTFTSPPMVTANEQPEAYIELHLDLKETIEGRDCVNMRDGPARLRGIFDYIILVTPLSLTDPLIGEGYRDTLQEISSLSAFGVPNIRQIQIHGFVAMKLVKPQKPVVSGDNPEQEGSLVVPKSEKTTNRETLVKAQLGVTSTLLESYLMSQRRCLLYQQKVTGSETSSPRKSFLTRVKSQLHKRNRSREEILGNSRNWMIQEKAIVVPCPKYVLSVAFLTVALVAGGMACAFAIGERIAGVDPFNLTNFSWLVGGLSILVAKSMRVSEWTWRDFLSGRVSCRTVQELSDVTGLDPQDILFFLLSSEMQGVLSTGGPFQSAFHRSSEVDGFAIDVKPNLQTLLASGIVLVEVLTLEGPALRWLRMVPGYRGPNTVNPSGTSDGHYLQVCKEPPRAQEDGDAITTFDKHFRWIKILGLYNLKDVQFR